MDLPVGSRLGHYRIVSLLGRGGMGVVYTARDERLNRDVALKVLARALVPDPEYLQRFVREARSAAALDHPGIARILHVGEERGVYFLVFELVRGGSVKERIKTKGPYPWRDACATGAAIARALAAVHAAGYVHRDLKPDNVLLDETGAPKLADFGLARRVQTANRITETGEILGTPGYLSPEQIDGTAPLDALTDLYALGCVLFTMLSGRAPFVGSAGLS